MRPAVVACRLLQLNQTATYEHTREHRSSQRDEGRNPLRVLCLVVTRPSYVGEADGPRATCSGALTPVAISSREGLGAFRYE